MSDDNSNKVTNNDNTHAIPQYRNLDEDEEQYYTYNAENEPFLIKSINSNDCDLFKKHIDIGINGTDSNYKCYILNIIWRICIVPNRLEFIKYLLEQESHINSNYSISNILEDACVYENLDIVRFLVQHNCNIIETFDKILLEHTFSESYVKILRDIMNENYFVKPCCKK
jgi:ankyrin repeat protein